VTEAGRVPVVRAMVRQAASVDIMELSVEGYNESEDL